MNGGKFKLLTLLAATALVLFCAGNVLAAAQGACVNCHTMHNSQDGLSMRIDTDDKDDPAPALLRAGSCYGCHGDGNIVNGTWDGTLGRTPRVNADLYNELGTEGNTLAGGSFYWVEQGDDAKGHNVLGVSPTEDAKLGLVPPGWSPDFPSHGDGGIVNNGGSWTKQLTCAGVTGCHGSHKETDEFKAVKGGHHGDDSVINGDSVAESYRFLLGIKGKEAPDWEYRATSDAHNQYYGVARKSDIATDKQTISYLCAQCHGDFHSGAGNKGADDGNWGAPWLRHPTDLDMNDLPNTEYADYNEGGSYSVVAPVASEDVSDVKSAVLVGAGDAIVTCISCHRAHGSPYDDLLRWAYNDEEGTHVMKAANGAGNVGCFICHTTKD